MFDWGFTPKRGWFSTLWAGLLLAHSYGLLQVFSGYVDVLPSGERVFYREMVWGPEQMIAVVVTLFLLPFGTVLLWLTRPNTEVAVGGAFLAAVPAVLSLFIVSGAVETRMLDRTVMPPIGGPLLDPGVDGLR